MVTRGVGFGAGMGILLLASVVACGGKSRRDLDGDGDADSTGSGAGVGRCVPGEVRCFARRERCSDAGAWVEEDFVCVTDISGSTGQQMACAVNADGALACFGAGGGEEFYAEQYELVRPRRAAVVDVDVAAELGGGRLGVCTREADGYFTCWELGGSYFEYREGVGRISADNAGACGLGPDGELVCPFGEVTPPAEQGPYVDLDMSSGVLWALHADGTVRGGSRAFPSGSFVQIAASGGVACAVSDSGQIVCVPEIPVPDELADDEFVKVAVEHWSRVCAIRADGTIACFGGRDEHAPFTAPEGRFVEITPTSEGMCAIRVDGSIHCFSALPNPLIPPDGW